MSVSTSLRSLASSGAFARGALSPGGRARASTRFGDGAATALGSTQPKLGVGGQFSVLRNLSEVRDRLSVHRSLGELARELGDAQAFVRSVQGNGLTEASRAALNEQIAGLNARLRDHVLASSSGREYTSSPVPAVHARPPAQAVMSDGGAKVPARGGGGTVTFTEYINGSGQRVVVSSQVIQRTTQELSYHTSTVLDGASGLAIGATYGSKQLSTVDVSGAVSGATYSLAKIVNSYNAINTSQSTMVVGTAVGSNTVTAINVSGASAGIKYKLKQELGSLVSLTNTTTLQSQTIDVSVLAAQSGSKTLNFNELGVSFTLTGAGQTGLTVASAVSNKETRVILQTDYSLKLTNTGSGAFQTLLVNGYGEAADTAVANFNTLGVSLTFSGAAGTTSALVDGLHGLTAVTRDEVTEIVTQVTEEVTVEVETIVDENFVIPVQTEVALRDYEVIASLQPALTSPRREDAVAELSALDARLGRAVADVAAQRAALEEEMTALAQGSGLDSESARDAVRALVRESLGVGVHGGLEGAVVAALLDPARQRQPGSVGTKPLVPSSASPMPKSDPARSP